MANSRYEFTGINKDGKTDKVQVSALNLKLAEQQAKKTFVRITQTVRMRDDVAAALDGTAASA